MKIFRCFIILIVLLSTYSLFANDEINLFGDHELSKCSKCGKKEFILLGDTCDSCRKLNNKRDESTKYLKLKKCSKCGKEDSSDPCLSCSLQHSLQQRPLKPIYPSYGLDVNHTPKVAPKPNINPGRYRGRNAIGALLATVIIGIGVFLFFEYPILGVIVIIIGLFVAYLHFRTKSESTVKESEKNNNSSQTCSLIDSDSQKNDSPKGSCRPRRLSDTDENKSNINSEESLEDQSSGSLEKEAHLKEKTKRDPSNIAAHWFIQGVNYCTGKDGRIIDYQLAKECFQKSKTLGDKDAEKWLDYIENIAD